ncbi:hypothetical protein DBR43_30895 [Pedobacter sp. KBW06]|nr:hypothetical protein DBR43_30895 [Pedobacter sp. KBW06]
MVIKSWFRLKKIKGIFPMAPERRTLKQGQLTTSNLTIYNAFFAQFILNNGLFAWKIQDVFRDSWPISWFPVLNHHASPLNM